MFFVDYVSRRNYVTLSERERERERERARLASERVIGEKERDRERPSMDKL